ncbi:HigA family addiction module antitoxin [Nitrosomonas supralitoralis]|nr:HigA family addiction module antitoxin [Nitrosomonas supralitoralis]
MPKRVGEPIHPGEILAEELEFMGINGVELATKIDVPKNRIYQIVNGERSITADTALRLGKFFGTGPRIWLKLQIAYDLDVASKQMGNVLNDIFTYEHQLT